MKNLSICSVKVTLQNKRWEFAVVWEGLPFLLRVGTGDSTWARWFENADRHVGKEMVGPYFVSTVFLGLDYDFLPRATSLSPLIFETMIFDHSREEQSPWFERKFHPCFNFQRRCRTWNEAVATHEYATKIAARMLRWMEFRSLRQASEVAELNRMLEP
jgi:hypothetical protein